jgi:hypothetical protein
LASATPVVGDASKFSVTMVAVDSSTLNGVAEIALISQSGDSFQLAQTVTIENNPAEYTEQTVKATDLIDDETIASVLENCTQYGGMPQTLNVPAGTFSTCLIRSEKSSSWIGQVPFGLVRQVNQDENGTLTTLDLMSFVAGHN